MRTATIHCLTIAIIGSLGCASSGSNQPIAKKPELPAELTEPIYKAPTDPSAPPAGHSNHGEAFNRGPRQAAYLMEGKTANIDFPIATSKPLAQKLFNQGIGQLHGFWTFEAERSFRQVLKIDPENPMAYFGMALANGSSSRAKEFIGKAVKHQARADERGRMWIDARAAYLKETNKKKRQAAYLKALEAVSKKYPDDLEALSFLALQHYRNGVGKSTKQYETVDAIIGKVLGVSGPEATEQMSGVYNIPLAEMAEVFEESESTMSFYGSGAVIADLLVKNQQIPAAPDFANTFDASFVEALNE